MISKIYKPNLYYKSIYDIDYDYLRKEGIKYLLFDLDNTLARVDVKDPSLELVDFLKTLDDFKIIVFSNGLNKRVKCFSKKLGVPYVSLSFKPLSFKYKRLIKKDNLKIKEIAAIGDQLYTDIKGANKMGILSILVKPISKKESIVTKFNRIREKKLYKEFNIMK